MSLLTATRLAPGCLRASSSLPRLVPSLNSLAHPVPQPPTSTRHLQSSSATRVRASPTLGLQVSSILHLRADSPLAAEVRPRTSSHASTDASRAAVAAGSAHTALMRNLTIPAHDQKTGLKHGATPQAINSTALRPEVRDSESGINVVGGGRGAEGAYKTLTVREANDALSSQSGTWTLMNPIYTESELDAVKVVNREPVTLSDKGAHGIVKLLRRAFDLVSGYVAKPIPPEVLEQRPIPVAELRAKGDILSDKQWLLRIILLESIAGVPGMVAGTLRHLRSLRLMRRDGGWIHTLLEEAENERMHLLTFLTVSQPTIITRALVLAAQGVFYNVFFLTYLFAPKTAHRFVGALEEEAVRTYTHCIEDVQNGLVPEWNNKPAPQIAIDYWRMPADATLLDVIKVVRADEATHRFVNHSLANLDQKHDFNPFALAEADPEVRGTVPGFTREESAEFARQTQRKLLGGAEEVHGLDKQEVTGSEGDAKI